MRFAETILSGAYLIDLEPRIDERGFFARAFCEREFAEHGIPTQFPQSNLSRNHRAGTLRGMHFEAPPSREAKLVRCVRGAVYDVIVDLRMSSPTRMKWLSVELSSESGRALYVPSGFAHGFITLVDETDVFYDMGDFYHEGAARGFRYDDAMFGIEWPARPRVISDRDATYADFDPTGFDA